MKTTVITMMAAAVLLVSCSDDDNNGITQQAHNENEIMTRMHSMIMEMEAMPMTNDPDIDFAKMMIMHHEGAIEMANYELENGDNTEMKAKAQSIITEQQQEISELQQIVSGLTDDEDDMDFSMELMMSMDKMDRTADAQVITGDTDSDFAKLMIVHHQAALDNASAYLHHGSNPELMAMAQMMVDMQTQEIIELADWIIEN